MDRRIAHFEDLAFANFLSRNRVTSSTASCVFHFSPKMKILGHAGTIALPKKMATA